MTKLTASNIVSAIDSLPKDIIYDYPNSKTQTKIRIVSVTKPEGPIYIKRYNPKKGKALKDAKQETISAQMVWRIANAITEGKPINIDRVLGASYNTRSAFEALLLHTPEFYICKPGRIETLNSSSSVKQGHKHMLWLPDTPHKQGVINEVKTDVVISEVPVEAVYEALDLPSEYKSEDMNIDVARRHAQIQIALILIGQQLGFRTWVAQNDKGIIYKNNKIGEMKGIVPHLSDEKIISAYGDAVQSALLIDCIWFRNSHFMPAVIEIEHSTGVTSGLTRMKNFYDRIPKISDVRWVIAAPDEDREKVFKEANKPQFHDLNTFFLPYSAVEELFSLCQRRKIKGINDDFLNCFMEPCLA